MGAAAAGAAILIGTKLMASNEEANAQKVQGKYQKSVFDMNSKVSQAQAEDSLRRGKEEVDSVRRHGKQVIGEQRVNLASQGIELDSGSALDIQLDTRVQAELDAITVRTNAFRESMGFRTQASMDKYQGKLAKLGSNSRANTTLMTGGLSAAGSSYQYYNRNK